MLTSARRLDGVNRSVSPEGTAVGILEVQRPGMSWEAADGRRMTSCASASFIGCQWEWEWEWEE